MQDGDQRLLSFVNSNQRANEAGFALKEYYEYALKHQRQMDAKMKQLNEVAADGTSNFQKNEEIALEKIKVEL